jgi:hypothetical protein
MEKLGLEPLPERKYSIRVEPVLPAGSSAYYIDPLDSSIVWSQEGIILKVKPLSDDDLNREYAKGVNPFTLGNWKDPEKGYTPPLYTVFQITVINQTRERVEFDLTRVVLKTDMGWKFHCHQGSGPWDGYPYVYDYGYLRWSSLDGNTKYTEQDKNQIWERSVIQREKPVRKDNKYSGKITFPPLPTDVTSFTLEVNDFILAFDAYKAGYGNPTETTNISFSFKVHQSVTEVKL